MITLHKLKNNEKRCFCLQSFNEEEIRFICEIIAYPNIRGYFTKNSKQFNKIRPGFRPNSISEKEAQRLIIANINSNFITSFIERSLEIWLSQIKEYYDECISNGDSYIGALLHTLPFSVFSKNIKLYFKILEEDLSDNEIEMLNESICAIAQASKENEEQKEELKSVKSTIHNLQSQITLRESAIVKNKDRLKKCEDEIQDLKSAKLEVNKLKSTVMDGELKIELLKNEIVLLQEIISDLRKENIDLKVNAQKLEKQIRIEIKNQMIAKAKKSADVKVSKRPDDMDGFMEYLGYNLINIGVPQNQEYYPLLLKHLCDITFTGVPIITDLTSGTNIAKCVSNALIGKPKIDCLDFNADVSIKEIDEFLLSCGRVVCLNNFIGNFNETELIPLFEAYKNKIVFLTTAYDRTLNFISKEFLRYCHYLNVNRIQALTISKVLTEDPSSFSEKDYTPTFSNTRNKYSDLLRTIMSELRFLQIIIEQKSSLVSDEDSMIQLLSFDILPYCIDVLQMSPFNASARLLKYAGDAGRCPKKNLFKEWFVR